MPDKTYDNLTTEQLEESIALEIEVKALRAENERLRAQNDELHRQIDYVRSLTWDDIAAEQILVNLRHMLDRPKA